MKHLLFTITVFMGFATINAQSISKQVLSSSGAQITNGNYNLNFTASETIVGTVENNGVISQGFWSELDNNQSLSQEEIDETIADISIYPNPVVNHLYIKYKEQSSNDNIYTLFDINGEQVFNFQIINETSQTSKLNISSLSNGVYVLLITNKHSNFNQSFKIIKK